MNVPSNISEFVLRHIPHPTYVVGGACRDHFLGRTPKDYDLAVEATEDQMKELGFFPIHPTAPVFAHQECKGVEFACTRKEIQTGTTSEHFEFETGVLIEEDLRRRDITVNAIAWDIKGEVWIDPFNGVEDAKVGIARIVDESTFFQSPERILRFFADCSRFELTTLYESMVLLSHNRGLVKNIPTEQIWKQGFKKLLGGTGWSASLEKMKGTGILEELGFPKNLLIPKYSKSVSPEKVVLLLEHYNPGLINRTLSPLMFFSDEKGWKKKLESVKKVSLKFRKWLGDNTINRAWVHPGKDRSEVVSTIAAYSGEELYLMAFMMDRFFMMYEWFSLMDISSETFMQPDLITSKDLVELGIQGKLIKKTLDIAKEIQYSGVLS